MATGGFRSCPRNAGGKRVGGRRHRTPVFVPFVFILTMLLSGQVWAVVVSEVSARYRITLAPDPGAFDFEFVLGSSIPATRPDGTPINTLLLRSSEADGRNHIGVGVSLDGAELRFEDGTPFSGMLFDLVIDSDGIIDTLSDIRVDFRPGALWPLDPSTILEVNEYILANLSPIQGGFGIPAGTELPLFLDPVDPLQHPALFPALTFLAAAPGPTAMIATDVHAETIPEPGSLVLLAGGFVLLMLVRQSLNRRA